jgi:polyphenol oxidase
MLPPMLDRAPLLEKLAVVHGFTTRLGGVSQGRYATLNVGKKWGDDPEAVAENLRRVANAGGFELQTLRTVKQVHGAKVLHAARLEPDSEADALWVHREDAPMVVGVLTADCVPILLADRFGTVACAIHSGWRGTVAQIARHAVQVLVDAGVAAADLVAAIGPCIEQPAFEVGDEVASQFDPRFVTRVSSGGRPHVDLVGACRAQLLDSGVPEQAIERVGGCTHANPDRWFSYRRDGAGTGQLLSFVGFTAKDGAPGRASTAPPRHRDR